MQQATNIRVEVQDLCNVLVSLLFNYMTTVSEDRDRVDSIETHYELDGPEISSRWGRDIPNPSGLV
jgi:hypothetical protein